MFTKLTPNLVKAWRKQSGLTKPLLVKSVNLKAFNSIFSSLNFPLVFKLNLFLISFSSLNSIYIKYKLNILLTHICLPNLGTFLLI